MADQRKSYMVYRTVPFLMTMNDPKPRFQGQAILRRITLAESSMVERLQAVRSGLQMFSWPGTVIYLADELHHPAVRVSKVSFCFVSKTVCSPYPTLNLRRPSFSSRRCTDLEQSSAAYHISSVTFRLLLSLEDILRTLLLIINVVVPAK